MRTAHIRQVKPSRVDEERALSHSANANMAASSKVLRAPNFPVASALGQYTTACGQHRVPENPMLDALALSAAAILQVEIGIVTLLHGDSLLFIGTSGTEARTTQARTSFCIHMLDKAVGTALQKLEILDATRDPRFANNPAVVHEATALRYYCGVPLCINGQVVGGVCGMSRTARTVCATESQIDKLKRQSRAAATYLLERGGFLAELAASRQDGGRLGGPAHEAPSATFLAESVALALLVKDTELRHAKRKNRLNPSRMEGVIEHLKRRDANLRSVVKKTKGKLRNAIWGDLASSNAFDSSLSTAHQSDCTSTSSGEMSTIGRFQVISPLRVTTTSRCYVAKSDPVSADEKACEGAAAQLFVIKSILKNTVDSVDKLRHLSDEVKALRKLRHDGIIRLVDTVNTHDHFSLVLEHGGCEDLFAFMERFPDGITDGRFLKDLAGDILSAVVHCHKRHVVHMDIKPENIVMTPDMKPKLCDFGLAHVSDEDMPVMYFAGTVGFYAPETLDQSHDDVQDSRRSAAGAGFCGFKSDAYSTAATILQLIMGLDHFEREFRSAYIDSNGERITMRSELSRAIVDANEAIAAMIPTQGAAPDFRRVLWSRTLTALVPYPQIRPTAERLRESLFIQ